MEDSNSGLWTPSSSQDEPREASLATDELVESVAGCRLHKAEAILPGIAQAVRERVAAGTKDDVYREQLKAQLRAYADQIKKRPPDAYLIAEQTVEQALQRIATGGRAASIMTGVVPTDTARWEDDLAQVLLDEPRIPLALESTRIPRPLIPPPPSLESHLWNDAMVEASHDLEVATPEDQAESRDLIFFTLEVSSTDTASVVDQSWLQDWRAIALVENRVLRPSNSVGGQRFLATRYRVL